MLPRCALADLGLCVAWGQGDRQTPRLHHHADTVLERYRSGSRLHHRMEKPGTSVFPPPLPVSAPHMWLRANWPYDCVSETLLMAPDVKIVHNTA